MSYLQSIKNINFAVVDFFKIYFKCILEVESKQQKDEREEMFHLPPCFQPSGCVNFHGCRQKSAGQMPVRHLECWAASSDLFPA